MHWVCTVFPYALGNTVETQWTKLNLGLLLWDDFVVFSLFFSLNEGKQTPLESLLLVLLGSVGEEMDFNRERKQAGVEPPALSH
jgi:hypothetical protein